jgi:hypothetical protein
MPFRSLGSKKTSNKRNVSLNKNNPGHNARINPASGIGNLCSLRPPRISHSLLLFKAWLEESSIRSVGCACRQRSGVRQNRCSYQRRDEIWRKPLAKDGWSGGAMSFFEQAEVVHVVGPIDNAKHRDTMPLANCTWGFGEVRAMTKKAMRKLNHIL